MSEIKTEIHALPLDTPCIYHPLHGTTLLYIANTVLFVATASHLQCDFGWFPGAKRAHPCWEVLPSSMKLDGTCPCIHHSPPSHYSSLCFCKFFVLESPYVNSRIPNNRTTDWLNFNLHIMSSISCITQLYEPDKAELTRYLGQKTLYNNKWLWQENVFAKQTLVKRLKFARHFVVVYQSLVTCHFSSCETDFNHYSHSD